MTYKYLDTFFVVFSLLVFASFLSLPKLEEKQVYEYGIYRLYNMTTGSYSTSCNRHNIPMKREFIDLWKEKCPNAKKLKTKDKRFKCTDPYPYSSAYNYEVNVCNSTTFLLMMFPIRCMEISLRNILREMIPQNLIVEGKQINRVFVVAIDRLSPEKLQALRVENQKYKDMVFSRHKDSYKNVPHSVWNGLMWVHSQCQTAKFVGKFDPDSLVFLGNLIYILKSAPTSRYFAARVLKCMIIRGQHGVLKWKFPFDLREGRRVCCPAGAGILLSQDIVDLLLIGARYETIFNEADDLMMASVLKRIGIEPQNINRTNCNFLRFQRLKRNRTEYLNLENNIVIYHDLKKKVMLKEAIQNYGSRLYIHEAGVCE